MRLARAVVAPVAFAALSMVVCASAQPIVRAGAEAGVAADGAGTEPPPKGPAWPVDPAPSATSSAAPRPDPGPGLRERSSRGRRANPASGVLFILVIVGAIGWYVVKKLKR